MKLIHIRFNANYIALLKAGVDKFLAKLIAVRLRIRAIIEVVISDSGVHVKSWDGEYYKQSVFKFN